MTMAQIRDAVHDGKPPIDVDEALRRGRSILDRHQAGLLG